MDAPPERVKRGRKRKVDDQTRVEKKKRINSNEAYVDSGGNFHDPKEFRFIACSCKKKCHVRIQEYEQRLLFNNFQRLGNFTARLSFIASNVSEFLTDKNACTDNRISRRSFSRRYQFNGFAVCQAFFLGVLQINSSRVGKALEKWKAAELEDQRGKSSSVNKFPPNITQSAEKFIRELPRDTSHYGREDSQVEYLESGTTLADLHREYAKEFEENTGINAMSYAKFRQIFNTYNLKIHPPRKDTCKSCEEFVNKIRCEKNDAEKERIQKEYEDHLSFASGMRNMMKSDMNRSKVEANFETIVFDLEKVIPLPKLPVSVLFYSRQVKRFLKIYSRGGFS